MSSKRPTQRHRSDSKQQCPRCAEWIQAKAVICRFCGSSLGAGGPATPLPLVPGPLPIYAEHPPGDKVSAPAPPPTFPPPLRRTKSPGGASNSTQNTLLIVGAAAVVIMLLVIANAATTQSQLSILRQRMQQIEKENEAARLRLQEEEARRPCAWCKGAGRYQDRPCQACQGSGRMRPDSSGGAPLGASPSPLPSAPPSTAGREPRGLEGSGDTVYINSSGDHYHAEGCAELREGGMPTDRRSAEAMRYVPCPRCR